MVNHNNGIYSDLIQITTGKDENYIRVSDIIGITKIYHHPDDAEMTKGYPKYQVYLSNSVWKWIIVTEEEFEKYLKKYVNI